MSNDKFNIRPEDCEYIVKEDERKVICILNNTSQLFTHFTVDNLLLPLDGIWNNTRPLDKLYKKLLMPARFVGIATCSPSDEWDENTGKLIAFSRMKDKVNKSFFKRANTLINTYDDWLNDAEDTLNALGYKLSVNTDHRHQYINKMLGVKAEDGEQDSN